MLAVSNQNAKVMIMNAQARAKEATFVIPDEKVVVPTWRAMV